MIRIGILGIGFMGVTHFKAARNIKGGKVTAICTRDPKKLAGDWRGVQGNFGGGGGVQDLNGIRKHADMRDLFADKGVDLVDICLPTPLHRKAALAAFAAGKHVLLEKPIAASLAAADEMLAAAKKARRHFMVAQVLRFFPEFRYLKHAVESNEHGPLKALQLKRIIAVPDWGGWTRLPGRGQAAENKRGVDIAVDLHIHDTDFVNLLFGPSRAVSSRGVRDPKTGETVYLVTNYDVGRRDPPANRRAGIAVSACSGAVATKGIPFEHGYDAYFEKATVAFNSTHCPRVTVVDVRGRKSHPKLSFPDAFSAELQEAVHAVGLDRTSALIAAKTARDSLAVCLAEMRSAQSGRTISLPEFGLNVTR
ncbi:MAG: Gfo/Idh/MocA family oxidoreductase [Verrucomicrobia bacterium]|nr:Gfo/Idh/MocA family oxidoreductase [Verrucomicrobiota bacterium]